MIQKRFNADSKFLQKRIREDLLMTSLGMVRGLASSSRSNWIYLYAYGPYYLCGIYRKFRISKANFPRNNITKKLSISAPIIFYGQSRSGYLGVGPRALAGTRISH